MNNKTEVSRIIIQNEILCKKCDDVIYSAHRHDFKYCKCGSVAVDGGTDYLRRVGNLDEYVERSMSMDADALCECQEALHLEQDTERNDLGTVLAIIRVLRQYDMLDMSKF
jgi:hypothetical protein